jgi:TolB-like protein/DNA-binding winged helix-turn-helix (wHTH) protein
MSTPNATHRTYSFGDFTFDVDRGALLSAGADIRLRPKSFEVLKYLLERHGQLVSKDELLDEIWGNTVVAEDAVTQCLIDIRRAIHDDSQTMIRTVPRRGYIFDIPVTENRGLPVSGDASFSIRLFSSSWFRGGLGAVFVVVLAAALWWGFESSKRSGSETGGSEIVVTSPSIAVLSFTDMSPGQDQQYFADGIAEEILNLLTQVPRVRVIARTSSFSFKKKNADIADIANRLNVTHVLEGSVRKSGNQVRITAQLVDASTSEHLWSETFDRKLTDIFAIQEETAQAVAKALSVTLGVGEGDISVGGTRNFEAYDAYLAGISFTRQPDLENTARAIEQLEMAVRLDPNFANAWSVLSRVYEFAAIFFIVERTDELLNKSEAAASRAIEIAPDALASLHATAQLHTRHRNWMQVELSLKKAFELAPTDYRTIMSYGFFYQSVGRPREAITYFRRATTIEPLLLAPVSELGRTHAMNGEFEMALKAYDGGKDLIGNQQFRNIFVMVAGMAMDDRALIKEALETHLAEDELAPHRRRMATTMASLLDVPEAARIELHRFYDDPDFSTSLDRAGIGAWAAYFDDPELALKIIQELHRAGEFVISAIWEPHGKELRRLPGFKDLVQELGLAHYWRSTGQWGDFCRPIGEDDFECG